MQKCQNFNAIDDLLQVYQGLKDKGTVMEKHKNEFKAIYTGLEVLD